MKKLVIFLKPFSKYLLVVWVITIATVSSIPHLPTPKIETGKGVIRLDYLIHFCEYGALIFISLLSFVKKDFMLSIKKYVFITLAVIVFALTDEFHQKLIPGRTFNPKDILSNLTGIITGTLFCYFFFKKIASDFINCAKSDNKIVS
jgi:VanZ family protein